MLLKGIKDMDALGVATMMEEYAHKILTLRDAVSCEVISKWMVVMKGDMDTRSSMCMLKNGFRRKQRNERDYMGFTCES